jgi:hypothetical protein
MIGVNVKGLESKRPLFAGPAYSILLSFVQDRPANLWAPKMIMAAGYNLLSRLMFENTVVFQVDNTVVDKYTRDMDLLNDHRL